MATFCVVKRGVVADAEPARGGVLQVSGPSFNGAVSLPTRNGPHVVPQYGTSDGLQWGRVVADSEW